jgi:hypothetical protein
MFKSGGFIRAFALCMLTSFIISSTIIVQDDNMESLMLIEPPDQLIYAVGYDQELNLIGGKLRRIQDLGGNQYLESPLEAFGPDFISFSGCYFHEKVDFAREGVYLITLAKKRWFSQIVYSQYTVQVVPYGEYAPYLPGKEEEGDYWADAASTYCENVTAVMISPPSNIIYPVGYTGEIDLSGIVVKVVQGWFPKKYDIADLDYTLKSDVDFSTPGSYIVKVYFTDNKGTERWFCFTVAVAEKEEK